MPTPRVILLHLDETARTGERIRFARMLAEPFGAQVVCRPCSMSDLMLYPFAIGAAAPLVDAMRTAERQARDRLLALFTAHTQGSPAMQWIEPDTAAPWEFARHALYADLMVLGQRDPGDPADHLLPADFVPGLLLQSGRPAVVLPYAGEVGPIGRTVLVAWNESRESARALGAAMPWLASAQQVHVVTYGEDAERPLGRVRDHLRAHGVLNVALHAPGRDDDVGNRLLSLAADVDADLLVMGCYGHSRAREWAMGGATRSILDSMTLPVLLSH
jgi:nucleotide-binding universal stress UspA family protein